MADRTLWLAEALTDIADALDTDVGDEEYAQLMVKELTQLADPLEAGILLADESGSLSVSAAGGHKMSRLLAAELRLGEGPCTVGFTGGGELRASELAAFSVRWPRYCPAAMAEGYRTIAVLPLRRAEVALGAAAFLGMEGQYIGNDYAIAAVFARIAMMGILNRRNLRASTEKSNQLQRALDSRVLIEQAKGVLAARLGVLPSAAFDLLRGFARRNRTPLNEVAGQVINGLLTEGDLAVGTKPTAQPSR